MSTAPPVVLGSEIDGPVERLRPAEIVIGVLTYNNADTVEAVAAAAARGLARDFSGAKAVLVGSDAGSSDATPERMAATGLPTIVTRHDAPVAERVSVPFHGVPGRGAGLGTTLSLAHRLGARVLVLLEADAAAPASEWVAQLAGPVLDGKADLVAAAYARHRYEGTVTKLLIGPLVRALYGRCLHQPLGAQQALSGRLLEHLVTHPAWDASGRRLTDLWMVATAIADGFSLWEAWLGPHAVRSRTRPGDLPTMTAQALGAALTAMDRHPELWLEVRGSEPLPAVGEPPLPGTDPLEVEPERMIDAFRLGLRDLISIWELILAPDTLGEVLALDASDPGRFRFPDLLWARVVYDFALGHHYGVVHRDHLLRSLVPLYLGRTARYIMTTRTASAAASEAQVEAVGQAFERQKTYLVEHWR